MCTNSCRRAIRPDSSICRSRVEAVEPLGAETLLMVSLDGSDAEMIARIGRDTALRRGDRLPLALDTAAIHLFDPATTRAIA